MSSTTAPDRTEAAQYYFTYIDQVPPGDICRILADQAAETVALLQGISEERSLGRYAPDKWSIRQVVSHVNDAERLFVFRAFWFARGFDSPLPSFDQNVAVSSAGADERTWRSHVDEFRSVRAATLAFLRERPSRRVGAARRRQRQSVHGARSGVCDGRPSDPSHENPARALCMTRPKTELAHQSWMLVRHMISGGTALLPLAVITLFLGMAIYHWVERLAWPDAFLNAAMLLGGMGPVDPLKTTAGKWLAGVYALFAGVVFLVLAGVMLAPVLHHVLHKFHLETGDKPRG